MAKPEPKIELTALQRIAQHEEAIEELKKEAIGEAKVAVNAALAELKAKASALCALTRQDVTACLKALVSGASASTGRTRMKKDAKTALMVDFKAGILKFLATQTAPVGIVTIREALDVTDKKEITVLSQVVKALAKAKEIKKAGALTKTTYARK